MKMRRSLLLLVLLLAVFSGSAMAQDVPQTYCGDLAESDCSILNESATAMRELTSAAFDFQMDFGMSDIPEFDGDINFSLSGDGAYAFDEATLSAMMASPADMMEMMQNMENLPQMVQDILKGISADANVVLTLPQNLPDMDRPLPGKVGFSVRMVDGIGYINLDKLAELDPSGDLPRGWQGLDIATLAGQALAQQSDSLNNMPNMGMNMDMMGMYANSELVNKHITVTRAEDVTVDGQSAAVFNMSVDLGGLFSDPAFQEMLVGQIESMTESMDSNDMPSPSDMDDILKLYSTLFDGFVFNSTQTIGLDDHYVHQTAMTLDWALDLSSMGAAFGGSSSNRIPPINISFDFKANLSQFNNAPEITAPEDAQMVPLDELMGGGSF
jgi:hypothetical protein